MKPNANTIVKALILVGLMLGGTAKAASFNDHLKIDPSVQTVKSVGVIHVEDRIDQSRRVAVKDVPAANEIVDMENVHVLSVQNVSVKSESPLIATNVPKWQVVGVAVASQTLFPANHAVNLHLRC